MPFSLSLYLYNKYMHKVNLAFAQENKALSQADINSLLEQEDRSKAIRIFYSAVVDHSPIDGVPYYLNYPVNGIFYHDGHKKAVIAEGICSYDWVRDKNNVEDALMVLDKFIDPEKNGGYVQVIAWNALGKLAQCFPEILTMKKKQLLSAFGGTTGSLLGAIVFVDAISNSSGRSFALSMVEMGQGSICYRVQKLLINYFLYRSPNHPNPLKAKTKLEPDILRFLNGIECNFQFSLNDFAQGCREIDLIGQNHQAVFYEGTSQANVAAILSRVCRRYLQVIGAYLRINY